MPSQFFGLNIAYTGLQAANAAINTTGNNISNVETEGYSRQTVKQEAADALRTNTTYGMAGAGVNTLSIDQIRNKYYDLKLWNNNASLGVYDIHQHYMKQIEDYYTETDQKRGFGTIFNDMFSGLEEVYKNAGDDTKKAEFLSLAGDLMEYMGSLATDMKKLQEDANSEIKNRADEINSIASQIATLNQQINAIEINKVVANELRDKRNLLIDKLSSIVNTEVLETPVYTGAGSSEKSGIYNYSVRIAGGQVLVNGYDYNTIECVARENKVNQSDADGLYDLKWSNGLDFNMYGYDFEGELKGLIDVRDGNNEEYFHGNVTSTTASSITIDVTDDKLSYLQSLDSLTLNDAGKVLIGSKEFEYNGWEARGHYNVDGEYQVDSYTLYLVPGSDDPSSYAGKEAKIGVPIDYQGIPYYMEQMNEWLREFAYTMNKIERGAQDSYGNQAESLFVAKNPTDSTQYTFEKSHEDPAPTTIKNTDDTYYKLTALDAEVNKKMVKDVNKFGTTADINMGVDAQDITEKLREVKDSKELMSFRGCRAGEFLQTMLADVALGASNANTFYKNHSDIAASIENQRISVSGVDNDEEALNLVKYQEAYNLAAKMIQVMTEVYDRLILNTGV